MTIRTCNICERSFDRKSNYDNHCRRKTPCNESAYEYSCSRCTARFTSMESHEAHLFDCLLTTEMAKYVSESDHQFPCKHCSKKFTRKNSLKTHMMTCERYTLYAKKITDADIVATLIDQNKKLQEKLSKAHTGSPKNKNNNICSQKITNNITNNNTTNNGTVNTVNTVNNVNISINIETPQLVAFGKEDLNRITDEECLSILKRGFGSIMALQQLLHLSDKFPEYQNVLISSLTGTEAITFTGEQWDSVDKAEVIANLRSQSIDFLEKKIRQLKKDNKIAKVIVPKLDRLMEDYDDEEFVKKNTKDINRMLYNGKKKVKAVKKKMELVEAKKLKVIKA